MTIHEKQILFDEIRFGCLKGSGCAHASGVSVTYFPGVPRPMVDLESVNSRGNITANCRIPLPNDPAVLSELADYLEQLAQEIKTNG